MVFYAYSGMACAGDKMVIVFEDGTNQTVTLSKPSYAIRSVHIQTDFANTGFTTSSANNNIVVTAGTYGRNCSAAYGNTTTHLAKSCNDKSQCEYTIDYTVIGDPAVGCGKDYKAEWRCGNNPTIHEATASPEAGFRKKVILSCPR